MGIADATGAALVVDASTTRAAGVCPRSTPTAAGRLDGLELELHATNTTTLHPANTSATALPGRAFVGVERRTLWCDSVYHTGTRA
jgi:hypothetical protein